MQIAIIGAGNVGRQLGLGWSRAGHHLRFGVPDPTAAAARLAALGLTDATTHSVAHAVAGADVVVLAVPWEAVPAALAACGDLQGRVVMDVTNPLRAGPGGLELAMGYDTSGGETVAALAPGARVFKAMNQVGAAVMGDAAGFPTTPTMFVAGPESEALATILSLVRDLGFDARHVGDLRLARLLEPYAMLWIHLALSGRAPLDAAFALMTRPVPEARP